MIEKNSQPRRKADPLVRFADYPLKCISAAKCPKLMLKDDFPRI